MAALAILSLVAAWSAAWASSEEVVLAGTLETLAGATTVWQLPTSRARGVLFLAHGCNHRATDFWPQSAACTSCVGLPEEVRITQDALNAGLAVIAVNSADDMSRCWSIGDDGPPPGRHCCRRVPEKANGRSFTSIGARRGEA